MQVRKKRKNTHILHEMMSVFLFKHSSRKGIFLLSIKIFGTDIEYIFDSNKELVNLGEYEFFNNVILKNKNLILSNTINLSCLTNTEIDNGIYMLSDYFIPPKETRRIFHICTFQIDKQKNQISTTKPRCCENISGFFLY